MGIGTPPYETLENVLANDIANFYYLPLLGALQNQLAGRVKAAGLSRLKDHAIAQWRLTAQETRVLEVRDFILTETIPSIEKSDSLVDQVFLLFFFVDTVTGRKRFWCPGSDQILKSLGRPYDQPLAVQGTAGVTGLRNWEVPLSSQQITGIRGDLTHQYIADLTEDQLAGRTYNPAGDFLVGIKSVVFIGLPVEQEPDKRLGQTCICSTVPGLFGDEDFRETDLNSSRFFRPYVELVNNVKPAGQKEFPSFPQYFEIQARYREQGASSLARNWIYQTIGLRHKNRIEAEYIAYTGYQRIKRLLDAVGRHHALPEILSQLNEGGIIGGINDIQAELDLIRETELSRLRFYAFLSRFGHYALGDARVATQDADHEAPQSCAAFVDRMRQLTDQIRLTISSCPELDLRLTDGVMAKVARLDWGAFEFILHQLLENAADKGTGESIGMEVRVVGDNVVFEVSNSIKLIARDQPGGRVWCEDQSDQYYQLGGKADWLCASCLRQKLKDMFDRGDCWEPTLNGKRFGLFMIKNFIEAYYGGFTKATSWQKGGQHGVTFTIGVDPSLGDGK
jgi:hypothetical protein